MSKSFEEKYDEMKQMKKWCDDKLSHKEEDYQELKRKYQRLELRNCYLKHLETKLELFQRELESLSKLRRELT